MGFNGLKWVSMGFSRIFAVSNGGQQHRVPYLFGSVPLWISLCFFRITSAQGWQAP
jgi:hypothetical protein